MAEYEFAFTEVNQGFAIIEADSLEEAERLATEAYYQGQVAWHSVDVSVKPEGEDN